jgi:hypothetical protein
LLLAVLLSASLLLSGCSLFRPEPAAPPEDFVAATAPPPTPAVPEAFVEMAAYGEIPTALGPTLWVPQQYPAVQWREVDIPIGFATGGAAISSINFTLQFDSNRLFFDTRDLNGDNLPDAIKLGTADTFAIQFRFDPQGATSYLTLGISDLIAPIRSIPEGTLIKVQFLPKAPGTAFVRFASNPPVVFRNPASQVVNGQAIAGSVEIIESNRTIFLPILNNRYPEAFSIFGQVTENGAPRPGVVLQVQTGQIAWSDANGQYVIANLPAGVYSLIAILPNTSFNPSSRIVNLPPNANNQNFAVRPPQPTSTAPRPPTVTPQRTPTPSGPRCEERIFNGGFEGSGGWVIPSSSYPARLVSSPTFQGSRAMQTGIPNTWENRVGNSSVFQEFVLPFSFSSAVLKFHIHPRTGEPSTATTGDRQSVRLLDQNNQPVANLVGPMLGNQGYWMFYQFDLRNFGGRALRLSFDTYNDGFGSVTWMFVDSVSLTVCY